MPVWHTAVKDLYWPLQILATVYSYYVDTAQRTYLLVGLVVGLHINIHINFTHSLQHNYNKDSDVVQSRNIVHTSNW